jgi:ribosomal protein S27E
MRVPDDYVGKRVKCPSCGESQLVQAAAVNGTAKKAVAAKAVAAKAVAPAVSNLLKFQCDQCDKPMQAKSEHAGKTVRCPACQAAVKIPAPEEEVEEAEEAEEEEEVEEVQTRKSRFSSDKPSAKPSKRKSRKDDEEEEEVEEAVDADEEDEEDERPRKKKKKAKQGGGMVLWICVGVGALLLIGGGVALAIFTGVFGGGAAAGDLALIPSDAEAFVTVKVADIWNNPAVQDSIKAIPKMPGRPDPIAEMEKEMGVNPGEIDRATVVLKDQHGKRIWVVLSTTKPYDRKKITDQLKPEEKKYEGRAYQVDKVDPTKWVMMSSDRQLVIATSENEIKEVIDLMAGKKKGGGGKLASAVSAAGRSQFVAGFVIPAEQAAMANDPRMAQVPGLAGLKPIAEAQSGTLSLNANGNSLTIELAATYPNDAKAAAAKKALDDLKGAAPLLAMAAGGSTEITQMVKELVLEQAGADVKVKITRNNLKGDLTQFTALAAMGGLPDFGQPPVRPPIKPKDKDKFPR